MPQLARTPARENRISRMRQVHRRADGYPSMAREAREEGFAEIADWFETLAKAERSHAGTATRAQGALG